MTLNKTIWNNEPRLPGACIVGGQGKAREGFLEEGVCKLRRIDPLNVQRWKRNPTVVIWHHLLWDSLPSLTWLHVCGYWERVYDFKGHVLSSFCSNNWALPFVSFSLSLKKGFCGKDAHLWRLEFLEETLKNASFLTLQRPENYGFWIAQSEKKNGCFSKRSTPNEKNMFIIGNKMWMPKCFSPVTDYRKYFMFGVGREGRSKEWEKEERKKGKRRKEKQMWVKIFQAWVTEILSNLLKTVLWSLESDRSGVLSSATRFRST